MTLITRRDKPDLARGNARHPDQLIGEVFRHHLRIKLF